MQRLTKKDMLIVLSFLAVWFPLIYLREYINIPLDMWIYIVSIGELVLLIPLIYLYKKNNWTLKTLGFKKFRLRGCFLIFVLLIFSFSINIVYSIILGNFKINTQIDLRPIIKMLSNYQIFILVFGGTIIAPFAEELYFRSLIFKTLSVKSNYIIAAILSSILFASAHLYIPSFLPIFVLGFMFSYLYRETKSIWPSIIMHSINNLIAFIATILAAKFM